MTQIFDFFEFLAVQNVTAVQESAGHCMECKSYAPYFLKFFIFIAILKNSAPWRLIPFDSGTLELGQSQMSGPSESQPSTRGAHYLKFFVYHT